MSPGNDSIIIVSADGFDERHMNPSKNPKNTPAIVNVRSKLFRKGAQNDAQH